jgi:3-dehydroquinate synthase
MDKRVRVNLGSRSYDVLVGQGLLAQAGDLVAPLLRRKSVFIVTETRVAELHLATLTAGFVAAGIVVRSLAVAPGEGSKSWAGLTKVVEWLLDEKVERKDMVIALGGGVIGDLVGFACAILRRGVRFVQVPTSLLAQVDSSVGGKTGINTRHGKNLVGAFHQPSLVLADVLVLETLPKRDFLSGYGEVAKYGLLGDLAFFEWLEKNAVALSSGDKSLQSQAVSHCVSMKAAIVERDETEEGERALLNLGHTFGHALEAATGYSDRLLHGEGVAIGMGLAFELSARLGLCSQEDPSRVRAHLRLMGMKATLAEIAGDLPDVDGLLSLMAQDKKVVDGKMRFILVRGIGQAFVASDVPGQHVRAILTEALAERH